jgi:hypothetical protein
MCPNATSISSCAMKEPTEPIGFGSFYGSKYALWPSVRVGLGDRFWPHESPYNCFELSAFFSLQVPALLAYPACIPCLRTLPTNSALFPSNIGDSLMVNLTVSGMLSWKRIPGR